MWLAREASAGYVLRMAHNLEGGHPNLHRGGQNPWDPHHAAFFVHKYARQNIALRKLLVASRRVARVARRVFAWLLRGLAQLLDPK